LAAQRRNTAFGQIISVITSIAAIFVLLDEIAMRLVHRDEPLRRRAKDHRILAAPAMRITMVVLLTEKQHSLLAHKLNDRVVRFEHALTREMRDIRRESARVIDGTVDLQPVTLADHEVVVTMTRRCVYSARARFPVRLLLRLTYVELSFSIRFTAERHVVANHQQRRAIEPRMPALESIEL